MTEMLIGKLRKDNYSHVLMMPEEIEKTLDAVATQINMFAIYNGQVILKVTKSDCKDHEPIYIEAKYEGDNTFIIDMKEWESIKETMYLEFTGTLNKVRGRELDSNSYTDIDDIEWDKL